MSSACLSLVNSCDATTSRGATGSSNRLASSFVDWSRSASSRCGTFDWSLDADFSELDRLFFDRLPSDDVEAKTRFGTSFMLESLFTSGLFFDDFLPTTNCSNKALLGILMPRSFTIAVCDGVMLRAFAFNTIPSFSMCWFCLCCQLFTVLIIVVYEDTVLLVVLQLVNCCPRTYFLFYTLCTGGCDKSSVHHPVRMKV